MNRANIAALNGLIGVWLQSSATRNLAEFLADHGVLAADAVAADSDAVFLISDAGSGKMGMNMVCQRYADAIRCVARGEPPTEGELAATYARRMDDIGDPADYNPWAQD